MPKTLEKEEDMEEKIIDWWQVCQKNGETDITKLIFTVNLNRGEILAVVGEKIKEIGKERIYLLGLTERGKKISLSGNTRLLAVGQIRGEPLF